MVGAQLTLYDLSSRSFRRNWTTFRRRASPCWTTAPSAGRFWWARTSCRTSCPSCVLTTRGSRPSRACEAAKCTVRGPAGAEGVGRPRTGCATCSPGSGPTPVSLPPTTDQRAEGRLTENIVCLTFQILSIHRRLTRSARTRTAGRG